MAADGLQCCIRISKIVKSGAEDAGHTHGPVSEQLRNKRPFEDAEPEDNLNASFAKRKRISRVSVPL